MSVSFASVFRHRSLCQFCSIVSVLVSSSEFLIRREEFKSVLVSAGLHAKGRSIGRIGSVIKKKKQSLSWLSSYIVLCFRAESIFSCVRFGVSRLPTVRCFDRFGLPWLCFSCRTPCPYRYRSTILAVTTSIAGAAHSRFGRFVLFLAESIFVLP